MNLFRLALPTVLLLYFVVKATHTRIFLLGIPFLMFISRAVFFEKMKPFWMPSRLAPVDLVMIWLLIVWVVYRDVLLPPHERPLRIAKPSRSRLFGWEELQKPAAQRQALLDLRRRHHARHEQRIGLLKNLDRLGVEPRCWSGC